MKAIFVSAAAPPSAGSHATRVTAFLEMLHSRGHATLLLTCRWPAHLEAESALYSRVTKVARVIATSGGILRAIADGVRARAGDSKGRGARRRLKAIALRFCIPDTFILWVPRAVLECARLGRREKFDVVVASGAPFSSHVAGWLLSMILRLPLALDYGDPWVYEPGRPRRGLRLVFERWLEKKILSRAAVVYVTTEETKQLYEREFPFCVGKVIVAPMGYDPDDFAAPLPEERVGMPLQFVYAGKVNDEYRSLEGLRAFMDRLTSGGIAFEVLFLGAGSRVAEELQAYVRKGVVESREGVDHPEYIRRLRTAHANIVLGNSSELQIPGKIANCLAARRPIAYFPNLHEAMSDPALALLRRCMTSGLYVHGPREPDALRWAVLGEPVVDAEVLHDLAWPTIGDRFVDGLAGVTSP